MKLRDYLLKQVEQQNTPASAGGIVLSSRVRLARNLSGLPFPWRAAESQLSRIWESSSVAIRKQEDLHAGTSFFLPEFSSIDHQLLMERHLISYDLAASAGPRGVLFNASERLTAMINEEDHVRLAAISPGMQLESIAGKVHSLDDALSRDLSYAFSTDWGYLTTCPTNAGTGMRASCLLHLPALTLADDIESLLIQLSKLGISVRGFYGEGSRVIGDVFQVANAVTMGRAESEILKNMEQVVGVIEEYERSARKRLMTGKAAIEIEDKVFRAAAILVSARTLDFQEAMTLISRVRLGLDMGFALPWKEQTLDLLTTLIQPAHLQMLIGQELTIEEQEIERATFIRQKLQ